MKKIIYHGSQKVITKPIYHYELASNTNDYGEGFYCTEEPEVGKEWACRTNTVGVINKYTLDLKNLNVLDLTDPKYSVLNWLAVLIKNRELSLTYKDDYKEQLNYLKKFEIDFSNVDVVIGYRADDAYFRFPKMFIENRLTLDRLEEIYKNGNLGKQIVLISEKSFNQIQYIDNEIVRGEYFHKYQNRVQTANQYYEVLELSERFVKGKKINDLIGEEYDLRR